MRIEELKTVVNEYLSGKEIELVEINVSQDDVIEVEIDAVCGVTIDQCGELSRHIENCFDREKQDYELTVASYSVSSPFKTTLQYRKNVGRDIEVLMSDGEVVMAKLTAVSENDFTVEYDEKVSVEGKKRKEMQHFVRTIGYNDVRNTKLMF